MQPYNSGREQRNIQLSTPLRLLLGVFLSALSAILLTLSMPPFGYWWLALIGLVPMVLAQYRILPARFSGLGMAITIGGLVGLYIMDAFLELPGTPWYMRGLPFLFAIFIFLTDNGTRAFHERTHYRWFILSGAAGWVGVELIRSFIPMLGTWGFMGYAFFKQPWLIQPTSIFGIFGMSLITLIFALGLGRFALALFDRFWKLDEDVHQIPMKTGTRGFFIVAGAFLLWVGLSLLLLKQPNDNTVRVAAVQPYFRELWTEEEDRTNYLEYERYLEVYDQLYAILQEQTREAAASDPDVIVWPEGALNLDPQVEHTSELRALAAETDAILVLPYGVDYRNEVTVLTPQGDFLGVYGKDHPVVFVNEYSTTGGTYPTYTTAIGELGTIICYDMDFTDTARKVASNGADLIAVPSGDWPGIADKHYAHVIFRAVENRTAMVKVDRNYDSAIIDPYGRILSKVVSLVGERRVLVADVPLVDQKTPQMFLGDWVGWISLVGMVFFTVLDKVTASKAKREK